MLYDNDTTLFYAGSMGAIFATAQDALDTVHSYDLWCLLAVPEKIRHLFYRKLKRKVNVIAQSQIFLNN